MASRTEAAEVIDRLFGLVERYGSASVADLYDMLDINKYPVDERWGWIDLRGATVTHVRNGYLLDLPKPEPIE